MNKLRGHVEVKAGPVQYRLRASWDVLARMQGDFSLDSPREVTQHFMAGLAGLPGSDAFALPKTIHRLLEGGGHELTYAEANAIDWDDHTELVGHVCEAFYRAGFWARPKEGAGEGERPLAPKKSRKTSGKTG